MSSPALSPSEGRRGLGHTQCLEMELTTIHHPQENTAGVSRMFGWSQYASFHHLDTMYFVVRNRDLSTNTCMDNKKRALWVWCRFQECEGLSIKAEKKSSMGVVYFPGVCGVK